MEPPGAANAAEQHRPARWAKQQRRLACYQARERTPNPTALPEDLAFLAQAAKPVTRGRSPAHRWGLRVARYLSSFRWRCLPDSPGPWAPVAATPGFPRATARRPALPAPASPRR